MYQHVQPAHERPPLHRTTYLASEPPEGGSRVGSAGPDMLSSRITPTITRVRLVVRCRLCSRLHSFCSQHILRWGKHMLGEATAGGSRTYYCAAMCAAMKIDA